MSSTWPASRNGVGSARSELCAHATGAASAPAGRSGAGVSSARASSGRSSRVCTVGCTGAPRGGRATDAATRRLYAMSNRMHLSVHAGAAASVAPDLALAASATVVTLHRSSHDPRRHPGHRRRRTGARPGAPPRHRHPRPALAGAHGAQGRGRRRGRRHTPSPSRSSPRAAASSSTPTATRSSTSARASPSPASATRTRASSRPSPRSSNAFTHTCFTVAPYEALRRRRREAQRLTPGDHVKRSALFNSGAEAVENAVKIARHFTKKQAVVAFDHAYHGRTNLTMGLTAKNIPYKSGFGPFASEVYRAPLSYPFRDGGLSGAEAAARAISADREAGRRREPRRDHHRAHPGRGRLHRARRRASCPRSSSGAARTTSSSSPTRCRPASPAPAPGSRASTRASCPTSSSRRRASPAACRSPRSPAAPRSWTPRMAGGLGGTYGGNPLACAAALATIDAYEQDGLIERASEIGAVLHRPPERAAHRRPPHRRRPRPRRDGRDRARRPRDRRARRRAHRTRSRSTPTRTASSCSRAAPTATSSASSPRSPSPTNCSSTASRSSRKDSRTHDRPARGDDDVDRNGCRAGLGEHRRRPHRHPADRRARPARRGDRAPRLRERPAPDARDPAPRAHGRRAAAPRLG